MDLNTFSNNILELIRRTSAYLPHDVQNILELKKNLEENNSRAEFAMDMILENIALAKKLSLPICQDTGNLIFYITIPGTVNPFELKQAVLDTIVKATETGYLRQNSVDSLTGKNSGNNLGPGTPQFHFDFHDKEEVDVRLILKGGGCENMSSQYSLPTMIHNKKFGRDLEGVRACILDAINNAQGKGCAPGYIGVCVGGDRASGYEGAKHQLLRSADDTNPVQELAELESEIMDIANKLEIGPLGFGGNLTIGCCKIGSLNRIPASFYVSIAYMCWAYRRRGLIMDTKGAVQKWLYQTPNEFDQKQSIDETTIKASVSSEAITLNTPFTEKDVRSLKMGDVVLINGTIFTGRDAVHKYLFDGGELDVIKNGVIYHCGPVMLKEKDGYRAVAAGPTTSIREEPYQDEIIRKFGIKAIIGKGGMGPKTLEGCKKYGAVYMHAIGGAAQIYAKCIKKVVSVRLEQFGSPEAVWELKVENFPVVVTMDSHGNSLHSEIQENSDKKFDELL